MLIMASRGHKKKSRRLRFDMGCGPKVTLRQVQGQEVQLIGQFNL